jgi:hypothetical protein
MPSGLPTPHEPMTTDSFDSRERAAPPLDGIQEFELLLPLVSNGATDRATHVVVLRGQKHGFLAALDALLSTDERASRALSGPVASTSIGVVADTLNSLDCAEVQSIDALPADANDE